MVETDALGQAAKALDEYITEINKNIEKMNDAAIDCQDNMGKDVLSQKAIEGLKDCITGLSKTIKKANELKTIILKKKKDIENMG